MKDAADRGRYKAVGLLRAMPLLAVPLLTVPLLTACATATTPRAADYAEARAACEFMRGGRPGPERRSAAGTVASPRLADCLQRRGWHADGTPTLEQLLRATP